MPAIVTGTVVRWEVINPNTRDERVKHKEDKLVSVYLTNEAEDADESALISKYTRDEVDKVAATAGSTVQDQLDKAKELLDAARQGLIRASGITRATVNPPTAP
jgi:hypothetical protein